MIRKTVINFALLICLSNNNFFAQLKVVQNGRVQIGSVVPNPYHEFIFDVRGNMVLSNYPASPTYEFRAKVGNGWPGVEIGANSDNLAIWSYYVGYNKLHAESFVRHSDSSYKYNVNSINAPLNKISLLKPYFYNYKSNYIGENGDSSVNYIPQYGFIAQEVEKSLPEVRITEDGKDGKLMDYDQIIPLLVAGMQEQQKIIKSMEAKIARLIATSPNYNSNAGGNSNSNNNQLDVSKLFSSSPNPFSNSTNLNYYLAPNILQAEIKVYDMQGFERKIYELIPNQGNSSVILLAQDLQNSGTYIYALFIDGQIIDAKTVVKQ